MFRVLGKLLFGACLLACASAHAQLYPTKPIRVINPYSPGGSGDVVARTIGAKLTEAWGYQVLLENRVGASGNIATAAVAQAPPDGYTLLLTPDTQMALSPHVFKNLPYNPDRDFAPIIRAAAIEYVLSVHPSLSARNLPELIDELKAKPGKYTFASVGVGSFHHLWMEWLKATAGVDVLVVPYKGGGQILPDLIAGEIQLAYLGLAQSEPHIRAGRIRPIALGAARHPDLLPGIGTVSETYPGGPTNTSWCYFAPAATPANIVAKLNTEINRVLAMPDVAERLQGQGLTPAGGPPSALADLIARDSNTWEGVVRKIGFTPE